MNLLKKGYYLLLVLLLSITVSCDDNEDGIDTIKGLDFNIATLNSKGNKVGVLPVSAYGNGSIVYTVDFGAVAENTDEFRTSGPLVTYDYPEETATYTITVTGSLDGVSDVSLTKEHTVTYSDVVAPPTGGGGSSLQIIQDFETASIGDALDAFGIGASGEIVADPETGGTRGQVAKLIGSAGDGWQGTNVSITSNYLLTTDKTIEIDVYSEAAITFAPKAQGGVDGAPDSVSTASHTGSGWETLTVTFDKILDGKAIAEGEYSEMAIHYFWDTDANAFGTAFDRVFYIDNISAQVVSAPPAKGIIQDFETASIGDALDAFGIGASGEIVADPETGGTRGQVAKLIGSAGDGWQGTNVSITSNYLLTTDKTIEIDVYSEAAITFAPKAQGGVDGAPDSVSTASHTGSGWETLTVTYDQILDGKAIAEGEYSEMAIHYFWDTDAEGFGSAFDRVFYIDNISATVVAPE